MRLKVIKNLDFSIRLHFLSKNRISSRRKGESMDLNKLNSEELSRKVTEICMNGDDHKKDKLIRECKMNPNITAAVFNNLYELVDYDLNLLIEVLSHSTDREKNTLLNNARDEMGLRELFDEYEKDALRETNIEDVVEGRDLDIIWEVKKGSTEGKMTKAYLTRCLLTIAFHIGFQEDVKAFFESEKRKYLTLH